jgi:hypothetical protein
MPSLHVVPLTALNWTCYSKQNASAFTSHLILDINGGGGLQNISDKLRLVRSSRRLYVIHFMYSKSQFIHSTLQWQPIMTWNLVSSQPSNIMVCRYMRKSLQIREFPASTSSRLGCSVLWAITLGIKLYNYGCVPSLALRHSQQLIPIVRNALQIIYLSNVRNQWTLHKRCYRTNEQASNLKNRRQIFCFPHEILHISTTQCTDI